MVPRLSRLAALAAGSVALLCGGIAIFSLSAAIVALPASEGLDRLRKGEAIEAADRADVAGVSLRAGRIFERGRYYSDAALAASGLGGTAQRAALDGQSLRSVVDDALVSAPASPQNWARRAALQLSARDWAGAQKSIETSLLLGHFAPGLTVPRLRIMLTLKQHAPSGSLQRAIEAQIRIAARSEPLALARFADGGLAEGETQRTLYTDFALYQAYLNGLMQARAEKRAAARAAAR